MRLAVFYIWGSLLAFSVCHICPETSEDVASWATLKPLGHCEDEENLCPYQLTLPPFSIQLPRPFREMEKMAKDLQDLKEVVHQLRMDCQECKDRQNIQRSGQKEYNEEKERRPQIPRHNISIKETQSHSGEQVDRILPSTLLQGDTSESEGTIKDGVKRLDHSSLGSQEWNISPRVFPHQGTTDQRSETSREVKIFNPSLYETPEDISKVKYVLSPTPEDSEMELKSKQSKLVEPSLPRKKDAVQSSTHGKQQPNVLKDGHVRNISGILTVRRRVQNQNVPDSTTLSSISRDANSKIMDVNASPGNRRVVKFPGVGGQLRPKGSYINSRVVKVTNGDRLKNPALVKIHNLQSRDMTVKPEPEEAGFSPVRSGVMRVKETSPHIANTKPGAITGPVLSTDDQNNQDISRVSGPRTDDGHVLKFVSQVAKITEENSRKVNKTGITSLPTNLRKENQGDVSHTATNKSISTVMNQTEQPNMIKEEKKHMKLSESLVVISSEEETISNLNREDLTFLGRQVENEKYLDLITETSNRQTDFKILDKTDSTFNERQVLVGKNNPQSGDMTVKPEPKEAGFSPARSGIMQVKETSHRIANTKPGAISGLTLSTDDQNKQDISRLSGSRTDDGHGLKDASKAIKLREDNLRKINKSGIVRLPTKLRKENQGEVSHIATNKSISTVMNPGEQPNVVKEEKRHMGLSESLVVISSEEEISSKVDREDLTFPGRQVENVKYLNSITEINNRQIDSTTLDKADSTFNKRTVNPLSSDLKDQMRPETFTEGANEHIGVKSLSAGTKEDDIPGEKKESKATMPDKDRVNPTLVPTAKSKLADSTMSTFNRVQSQVVGQGTRRISVTPLKTSAGEEPFQNSRKNISKIHVVSQDNKRYVMPKPLRHPDRHPTTVISHRVNKLRQPSVIDNMLANRSVGVRSKLSIQVRNINIARKNGSEIIRPGYIRKSNFQTEPNTARGFKTKVSTVTQFSSPTGVTEQEQTEEIKHIPQVVRSNVSDNKWLKNNSTESQLQPESQNSRNVQDLDVVQHSKNQLRENIETGSTEDLNNPQSGALSSPTGGKESKIFSLGTDDTSSRQPFEVDRISSEKKGPTAPILNKELSKEPGTNLLTTSTGSFMDTDHKDSPKNIHKVTNTHVEMAKNDSWETPISFEKTGARRELELIKFNKDRVEENSGEILSNPNSADTAQGYSGERYTDPVVLETLTNVEEIKGSKLFSLSPEDTAEGFKAHAVSDEVTGREQIEIHSTCDSDCNTTSTQQSTAKTRPPVDSGREKGPAQDCADYMMKSRRNGVYRVTLQPKSSMFPVFCDMESSGGGWTLIQHRFDGSTSFNRTWDEYKNGFGKLIGEFWLGNDKIHLLTKAKNMSLRIEIEDFEGIKEYAHYDHFYVANESQQYRLSIGGYSGTAGNAMQFSEKYDHDQKPFTTPDRDNDQYPSGNCGAYYSSGWWFDACMSANLNGRYYQSKYKGVRNGIFWGTWHNITMEYYPTNDRQSFKTVKMMIRPKNYAK